MGGRLEAVSNKWADVYLGGERYRIASTTPATYNEEADSLIHGNRNEAYGPPAEDFAATAAFWTTWLRHKYGVDITLDAHDIPYMMSLLKHSREANFHTVDNAVDICGYMGTDEMVYDYERAHAKRPPPPPNFAQEPVPGPDGEEIGVSILDKTTWDEEPKITWAADPDPVPGAITPGVITIHVTKADVDSDAALAHRINQELGEWVASRGR